MPLNSFVCVFRRFIAAIQFVVFMLCLCGHFWSHCRIVRFNSDQRINILRLKHTQFLCSIHSIEMIEIVVFILIHCSYFFSFIYLFIHPYLFNDATFFCYGTFPSPVDSEYRKYQCTENQLDYSTHEMCILYMCIAFKWNVTSSSF